MELGGMIVEPAAPNPVVWATGRDERLEARPVAEKTKVRELVDDHGLERFWRSEDQPP